MCGFIALEKKSQQQEEKAIKASELLKKEDQIVQKLSVQDFLMIFHRLAIICSSKAADQPFQIDSEALICNGEIFNHKGIRSEYLTGLELCGSDCSVILPLIQRHGLEKTCQILDGEFAFVAWEKAEKAHCC